MKFIHPHDDIWQHAPEDEAAPGPAAHRVLSWPQWQAVRTTWPNHLPVGVRIANDFDVEALEADLPRLALVVLHFPKWTDGRAYSQARLLRSRYRFAGEIRAVGEVLVDMLPLLDRTGVNAVLLRADQDEAVARRALDFFSGYYQGDVHDNRPLFARRKVHKEAVS
ncbi:MAG: hypothetical protein KatS3mg122_0936 [Caldimonas sp.]|uniref:DUF934 domain-containing protein n=1 Tax=Caldimonas TaxID=196013 RepID=UPI000367C26B|nr:MULTISPECIES: DUF934 domain-containing protein [Caldimonas]GIX23705.1 MAG: hypothetical protein KatS3mg122_0936 [Caldimonas sp.]